VSLIVICGHSSLLEGVTIFDARFLILDGKSGHG